MSSLLNNVSSAISIFACVSFVIGCVGYASDRRVFESLAWIRVSEPDTKVWFALKFIRVDSVEGRSYLYGDKYCTSGFCDRCDADGKATFALCVVACVFAAFTMGISNFLIKYESKVLQSTTVFCAILSFLMSLIALCVFMGDCFDAIDNDTSVTLHWGAGSIITLIGVVLMGIVSILQIVASVSSSTSLLTAGAVAEEEDRI